MITSPEETRDLMTFFAAHLVRRSVALETHPDVIEVTGKLTRAELERRVQEKTEKKS